MDVNIAVELYKYGRCQYVLTVWGRSGNERLGPDEEKKYYFSYQCKVLLAITQPR